VSRAGSRRGLRRSLTVLAAILVAAWPATASPPAPPAASATPSPPAATADRPAAEPERPPSALRFVDVAREAGLTAPTWCGGKEKPHILESGGTGLGLVDYDGDGDLDLYLVNGWRLDGSEVAERGRDRLYRNRGDGTFEDVTEEAGLGWDGWGTGIAAGDVDGDGWTDLFLSNFGPDVLYRNRGDGTFERVPDAPSIDGWSTGAAIFDADGDGDEDLFVGAYIDCTLDEVLHAEPQLEWEGMQVMMGPFGLEGLANHFYENVSGSPGTENGDGAGAITFRDATSEAGLADRGLFYSFGVEALDLDGDLDLDLYVANDSNPNYLFENVSGADGEGAPAGPRFKEVGLWSGAALDQGGNAQAGMGLATGDVDGDGIVDLLVTNFSNDTTTLYRNLGDLIFEDVTVSMGIRDATFKPLSWGATLSDLDLDGDLDLFIANGHIYPQADQCADSAFHQRNLLLAREGKRFVDVTDSAGPGLQVREASHGLAVGDVDGDGDLDLAISNVDAPPTLLRNDSARDGGSWLLVDAPGALEATVRIEPRVGPGDDSAGGGTTPKRRWVRHRVIGSSFLSVSDPRFHFGLPGEEGRTGSVSGPETASGPAPSLDLELLWPNGRRLAIEGFPPDRVLVVRP